MLILLSPAKTLDMTSVSTSGTQPRLLDQSNILVKQLSRHSKADLQQLMGISEKLAELNHGRFRDFTTPFTDDNAAPAGYAFRGDVYQDLEYDRFTPTQRALADEQIRILSGLYGVLRPSDLMQAYRLEMGTRMKNARGKNLYEFWGDRITDQLNADLADSGHDTVVNLASVEYFKSVRPEGLNARVLTPHFKELRKGSYKVVTFNAKRARGRLVQLATLEELREPEGMKELVVNDYVYNDELSTEVDWVWTK